MSRGSLAGAIAASVLIIATAPFVDLARAAVRAAFPRQFAAIVGTAVALAVVAAVAVAVTRIRGRRGPRYLALATAIAIGAAYAFAVRTGNPDVDAVERVHFVEYGLLAMLYFRVWRARGDWSMVVLPALAGILVGTLDESLQWFVPGRVGEAHDVFIDAAAVGCGLLFAIGFAPPSFPLTRGQPGSRRLASIGGAIVVAAFALFVYAVHVGADVHDDEGNSFRSQWSARELTSAGIERAGRWRADPPRVLHRLSREDHYLSEGLWHVQARNKASSQGQARAAWGENRILEEFFAPVLDTPSYASATPSRWGAEQRENARAVIAESNGPYVSDANPYPIYTWPATAFWTLAVAAVAVLVVAGAVRTRTPSGPAIRSGDPG